LCDLLSSASCFRLPFFPLWLALTVQFAGKGRMVILAETQLFYATFGADGAHLPGLKGMY
jgi:hypothetical protein